MAKKLKNALKSWVVVYAIFAAAAVAASSSKVVQDEMLSGTPLFSPAEMLVDQVYFAPRSSQAKRDDI